MCSSGVDNKLYHDHADSWADFWNKSYVSLPEKQDYLENLWYLNLYYGNCQMRGKYPGTCWNGVWGSFYDFTPWNCFFHYNNQLGTFPLEAANHPELTESYYAFRYRQLPQAQAFARDVKNSKGAFYADVSDLKGRNAISTKNNCTCGAQIAMGMYQHYRYTGDEQFLQEKALPVMRSTAEFYLDRLQLAEDGYYHVYGTEGYESPYFVMTDSITDLSMIRALYGAIIPLVSEEEAALYRERLEKLASYQPADFLEEELDTEGNFLWGIGKGTKAMTGQVLSSGHNPQRVEGLPAEPSVEANVFGKDILRRTYGNPERAYYGFPDTEMSPVFPAGLIGIKHKDTELYKMIYNDICLHPQVITDKKNPDYGMCMGWCMMPIYLARMGLAEYLERHLEQTISAWIIYPQGFGIYGPYENDAGNQGGTLKQYWKRNKVRNMETGERSLSPAWKFRHFNYETLPILATAVNEMLLQSYDGILRLFPAITEGYEGAFKLAAMDRRLVEAVYQAGECNVQITCSRGGKLVVAADHVNGALFFGDGVSGAPINVNETGGLYTVDTYAGQIVSIKTAAADKICIEKDYSRNMDAKHLGDSKLGTEKEY